jgi:hypothetical protein
MPAQYDVSAITDTGIEDVDKFNRMPFYLVMNEVKRFRQYDDFTKIWGDVKWEPNKGDTMKGVTVQPTPIGNSLFYPNRINTDPNKSVFEQLESTETCQLYWHDYQSRKFAFLPSWQDFRDNQLNPFHKEMVKQVSWGNNLFIRTAMWDGSPNVYFAGRALGTELEVGAPTGRGNTAQTAPGSKTAEWLKAKAPSAVAPLTLRVMKNAANIFMEDLDAPPFEGFKNMPDVNEAIKGRYILYGSNDAFLQLVNDPDLVARKTLDKDILLAEFKGPFVNDTVVWKTQFKPLRFNIGDGGGLFLAPETTEMPSGKTRPNPLYTAATHEIAFLLGADAYRTVKVGPPPRDFTGMSKDKFYNMRWNGEIRLTDQFLIQRGTVAGGDITFDTNDDGRFLKFKGTCVHGIMAGENYFCLPIVFKRARRSGGA